MKKIILFLIVGIVSINSTFAQRGQEALSPEERTEKILSKMKTDLTLSEEQVVKLKPVLLKREQQREELRAKMEDTKGQRKQMAKEAEADFKEILTPEQMEKLNQQRREMRENHKHTRKNNP